MEKNKKIVLPSIPFVYKHSRLRGTTSKCDVSTCNSITTQRERASKNQQNPFYIITIHIVSGRQMLNVVSRFNEAL